MTPQEARFQLDKELLERGAEICGVHSAALEDDTLFVTYDVLVGQGGGLTALPVPAAGHCVA